MVKKLVISFFLALSTQTVWAKPPAEPGKGKNNFPEQGSVGKKSTYLKGQVSEMALFCMASGISLDNYTLPTVITSVRPGTPAYYAGLQEGDKVLFASCNDNSFLVRIQRGGRPYQISMPIKLEVMRQKMGEIQQAEDTRLEGRDSFNAPGAAPKSVLPPPFMLTVAEQAKFFNLLAPYEVIFLIDCSGSMNGGLGIGPYDISRWTWCQEQLRDFSQYVGNRPAGGITLIPFGEDYQVIPRASLKDLQGLFDTTVPNGQTNIYAPLSYAIQRHLQENDPEHKPILIVVLTDGMPNLGGPVDKLITDTTFMLKGRKEMIITFLVVGEAPEGALLINELDNNLVAQGASCDIVNSMSFQQLLDLGLKRAIFQTLQQADRQAWKIEAPADSR